MSKSTVINIYKTEKNKQDSGNKEIAKHSARNVKETINKKKYFPETSVSVSNSQSGSLLEPFDDLQGYPGNIPFLQFSSIEEALSPEIYEEQIQLESATDSEPGNIAKRKPRAESITVEERNRMRAYVHQYKVENLVEKISKEIWQEFAGQLNQGKAVPISSDRLRIICTTNNSKKDGFDPSKVDDYLKAFPNNPIGPKSLFGATNLMYQRESNSKKQKTKTADITVQNIVENVEQNRKRSQLETRLRVLEMADQCAALNKKGIVTLSDWENITTAINDESDEPLSLSTYRNYYYNRNRIENKLLRKAEDISQTTTYSESDLPSRSMSPILSDIDIEAQFLQTIKEYEYSRDNLQTPMNESVDFSGLQERLAPARKKAKKLKEGEIEKEKGYLIQDWTLVQDAKLIQVIKDFETSKDSTQVNRYRDKWLKISRKVGDHKTSLSCKNRAKVLQKASAISNLRKTRVDPITKEEVSLLVIKYNEAPKENGKIIKGYWNEITHALNVNRYQTNLLTDQTLKRVIKELKQNN